MKHTIRFRNSVDRKRPRKRIRQRLKAAALAIGLATAWGGEACAETMVQLEVTPTRTLRDAWVYYANNQSSARFVSLGTLPENTTTTFLHVLNGEFEDRPSKLLPTLSNPNVGYWVIGVYDDGDASGIGVSFREETVVAPGTSWDDVFIYDEADIVDSLTTEFTRTFGDFVDNYGNPLYRAEAILPTHYGTHSTLVNFSDAEFGGTALATIVPEPSSIILVGTAGVFLVGSAFRRRVNQPCN